MNWRYQLEINKRRSYFVICLFFILYTGIGLIVDLYLYNELLQQVLFIEIMRMLFCFQLFPIFTLIAIFISLISILITFKIYDHLILAGTNYHEVKESKFNSLSEAELYNIIDELRLAAGFKYIPKIYVIDADYMNAFASGYSEKSALIAITKKLLSNLNRSELQAVMAHELSHIRHNDIKLVLMVSVLSSSILIALDLIFRLIIIKNNRYNDKRRDNNIITIIVVILKFLLPIITILLSLYLSRKREFMADAGAVQLTRDNLSLANALLKIDKDHKIYNDKYKHYYNKNGYETIRFSSYFYDPTNANIHLSSIMNLFSTHPTLSQRLEILGLKSNDGKKLG